MSAKKLSQTDEFVLDESSSDDTPATEQLNATTHKEATASKNGKAVSQPFDPTQYLSKFDGRDYLEVKWRLLWLRTEHPESRITTEIVQHNEENGFALFRAEVEVPGGGKATGW